MRKKKNRIIFRTDTNKNIGLGHIYRCIAVAKEVKKKHFHPLFVVRKYDNTAGKLLKANKMEYKYIKRNLKPEEEKRVLTNIIRKTGAQKILFDLYDLTDKYIDTIKKCVSDIFLIDDRNYLINPDVNAIINQNSFSKTINYHVRKRTGLFLGERYIMLEKFFYLPEKNIHKKRPVSAGVCLSSVGYNEFKELLDFLLSLHIGKIEVIFTIFQEKIMKRIKDRYRKHNDIRFLYNLKSNELAKKMRECRLFFCTGGTIVYQAIASGCCVFASSINNFQKRHVQSIAKRKIINLLIGKPKSFYKNKHRIENYLDSEKKLIQLRKKTRTFLDGKGSQRVADIICRKQFNG